MISFTFYKFLVNYFISTSILSKSIKICTKPKPKIVIIGGGASGLFSSISAAEALQKQAKLSDNYNLVLYEASKKVLTKVSISGGGRCNVMHDTRKSVNQILSNYPRGDKELTGIYSKRFTPLDARAWFEKRGVTLKTEEDGRVFPTTDSSQTIINALVNAAQAAHVEICKNKKVIGINKIMKENEEELFEIQFHDSTNEVIADYASCIILATGSSSLGYSIAESLGHDIIPPIPSLFSFHTVNQFQELAGITIPNVRLSFRIPSANKKKKKLLTQEGPMLITHNGISGPAVLRLSSFGARELHAMNYNFTVICNWLPFLECTKRSITSSCPFYNTLEGEDNQKQPLIPKRLWKYLLSSLDLPSPSNDFTWSQASKKLIMKLAHILSNYEIMIQGKSLNKEEFVTSGGISLKQVDMTSMSSKKCNGLFCCGEVLDVDGVTGGFNFMGCWSTGFIAGVSAVEHLICLQEKNGQQVCVK